MVAEQRMKHSYSLHYSACAWGWANAPHWNSLTASPFNFQRRSLNVAHGTVLLSLLHSMLAITATESLS